MAKNVWEEIWDYDPNGLMVLDKEMRIQIVNPAFLKIFKLEGTDILGKNASEFFDNIDEIYEIKENPTLVKRNIKDYSEINIRTSEVCYSIDYGDLLVKIFNDITDQKIKDNKFETIKYQVIEEVNKITEKQMKIVQEIASILGETTAETKASLFKLVNVLKET